MSYSSYGSAPTSRKISIPNDKVVHCCIFYSITLNKNRVFILLFLFVLIVAKVGVVIGKGGDTIKSLQLQSGARIQIAKESDPSNMASRDVDLVGTAEQVSRAEELINSVLAEVISEGFD